MLEKKPEHIIVFLVFGIIRILRDISRDIEAVVGFVAPPAVVIILRVIFGESSPLLFLAFVFLPLFFPFVYRFILVVSYYSVKLDLRQIAKAIGNDRPMERSLAVLQKDLYALREAVQHQIFTSKFLIRGVDHRKGRVLRDVDIFFSTVIDILAERVVSTVPFTPEEKSVMEIGKEDGSKSEMRELEKYKSILSELSSFLNYFYDTFILNPRSKFIRLVFIERLFERWNSILRNISREKFESNSTAVTAYYARERKRIEERREHRSRLFIYIWGAIVTLVVSYILNLFGIATKLQK